jgi:hypothetical protein
MCYRDDRRRCGQGADAGERIEPPVGPCDHWPTNPRNRETHQSTATDHGHRLSRRHAFVNRRESEEWSISSQHFASRIPAQEAVPAGACRNRPSQQF